MARKYPGLTMRQSVGTAVSGGSGLSPVVAMGVVVLAQIRQQHV
jgi:hypothetical protein